MRGGTALTRAWFVAIAELNHASALSMTSASSLARLYLIENGSTQRLCPPAQLVVILLGLPLHRLVDEHAALHYTL